MTELEALEKRVATLTRLMRAARTAATATALAGSALLAFGHTGMLIDRMTSQ